MVDLTKGYHYAMDEIIDEDLVYDPRTDED